MKQHSILQSIVLILIVVVSSFFATCDDEPSNPPPQQIDSTSHSFVFFTDTLGTVLSRVNDVFCLSETEAYAVGLFYVRDSTGKVIDSLTCNFARWDGVKWKLERVAPLFNGSPSFGENYSVFAFNDHDLWLAPAQHWNGFEWKIYDVNGISTGRTRKIWGSRSNDVWFAGENGSIMHWDGERFVRKGEITTAANCDIWGWKDTIYVAVTDYDRVTGNRGYLVRIVNGSYVEKQFLDNGEQVSVWGMNGTWYAGGCHSAIFFRKTGGLWNRVPLSITKCIQAIRGTALNNVYIATSGRNLFHFNGISWREILPLDPEAAIIDGMSTVGNLVMLADSKLGNAIVYRGYQQPIK